MIASLMQAGFNVWDLTMQDLCDGEINLDHFNGIVFPGGFSYAGNFALRIDFLTKYLYKFFF